eukprot:scaffold217276_cov30-Tisochrysis_lutea.AAC.2
MHPPPSPASYCVLTSRRGVHRSPHASSSLTCIVLRADVKAWRASLAVPLAQLAQVHVVGISHGSKEVIAGHGMTIVALE